MCSDLSTTNIHVCLEDMRGNWYIDIYLDDKDSIRVTHAKREQAFSYDEDEYFEFLWELTVRLNRDYSGVASANVEITDLKVRRLRRESSCPRVLELTPL